MMEVVDPLTGHLLIANAGLFDPNFRRSIVLVGHHDEDGAVGVVLNKPFDVPVREAVPPLADMVDADEVLFAGGPVEPGSVVVVADFADPARAQLLALDSIGFLPPEPDDVEIAWNEPPIEREDPAMLSEGLMRLSEMDWQPSATVAESNAAANRTRYEFMGVASSASIIVPTPGRNGASGPEPHRR